MSNFSKNSNRHSDFETITSFAEDYSMDMNDASDMGVGYSEVDNALDIPLNIMEAVETFEKVPGSDMALDEMNEVDDTQDFVEKTPKNWESDRSVDGFMNYIKDSYPHKIPKHDGKSMVGAERAVKWLTNLGKEISEAVRRDSDGVLNDEELEETRVKIMKDILVLKEHIKKLDKNLKSQLKKKAGIDDALMDYAEEIEFAYNYENNKDLRKTAAHPKLQLFVTPFERAISGIIINSVVSGGKPLEEVYDFLKEKYELTEREELAVMQIIMDSGFPIFKDRGTFSSKKDKDSGKKHGIEFIKNYFA